MRGEPPQHIIILLPVYLPNVIRPYCNAMESMSKNESLHKNGNLIKMMKMQKHENAENGEMKNVKIDQKCVILGGV